MRALAPMIAALAGLTIAVGCGEPEDVGPASSVAAPPPPVPPSAPKPSETVDEAGERIAEVIAGGDCDRISELIPLAAQATGASQAQCDSLAPLEGFASRRAAAYGGGGAVIGFEKDDAELSAVLVLDADGLYHLVGLDAGAPGVGTPLSPGFERPAAAAVGALRDKDCGAFRMSAFALYGGRRERAGLRLCPQQRFRPGARNGSERETGPLRRQLALRLLHRPRPERPLHHGARS